MRRALEGLDGVDKAEVSFEKKRAAVVYDPKKVQASDLVRVVEKAGYRAVLRP